MVDHCAVVDRCAVDRCAVVVQSAWAVRVARVALKREPARFCVLRARGVVTPRFVRAFLEAPDAPRDLPAKVCDKARTSPADRRDVVLRLQECALEPRKELPAVHLVRAIGERLAAELRDWVAQLGHRAQEIDLHHDRPESPDCRRYEG